MSETRQRVRPSRASAVLIRHGRLRSPAPWAVVLKFVAAALAVLLVSAASVVALSVSRQLNNITTVDLVGGDENGPVPTIGAYPGGYNFLIVGSDIRNGPGGVGAGTGAELNDVTMLLHVSEDHSRAVAVSIPRDLVVPIPECPDGEGGTYSSMAAQPINVSLSYGGLACTVLTVEELTGLDIQFGGVITFNGVIEMSSAVGGVDVCVDAPIYDPESGLDIPKAGTVSLEGGQALAFLRTRKGVGDGSDLGRISSQQVYLSSLVRKLQSTETLTNLPRLYSIASAATQNMTLSSNLKSLDTLVAIAQSLRNIPLEDIVFVQYPGTTEAGGVYEGKVAPVTAKADQLFELIAADEPFNLTDTTSIGSTADPNAPAGSDPATTATPPATSDPTASSTVDPSEDPNAPETLSGVTGQTAAQYTCSRAR